MNGETRDMIVKSVEQSLDNDELVGFKIDHAFRGAYYSIHLEFKNLDWDSKNMTQRVKDLAKSKSLNLYNPKDIEEIKNAK